MFIVCVFLIKEGKYIANAPSMSGSYMSIRILRWLKAHNKDKIKIPQTSVILFFDNNQLIIFKITIHI